MTGALPATETSLWPRRAANNLVESEPRQQPSMERGPMSVWSSTLEAFRNQVAAIAPVPSGGATACVCASLGLALLLMALRNANEKEPLAEREKTIIEIEGLAPVLAEQADNDVRTFEAYVNEVSGDSNGHSSKTIMDVTLAAITGARSCCTGLEMAERGLSQVLPYMRSDVVAAALIMHASLCALLINAKQDAEQLDSPQDQAELGQVIAQLQTQADQLLKRIGR
ncbi:hypothetical protein G7009_00860 [Pseudomonas capeferrum]|uniref:cyclodeaminase/cyclohydrolase family protein n=1 Tax=Pseudomonas capeferrum TaxID=1495066 RepID=UPI0015E2BBE7|nr:cyclodeaminase/cyclohydrolase family protein [Pseudomonas capeferrum]MBA1200355.1 hypothetical protein [Pseudomonas capeferrum]